MLLSDTYTQPTGTMSTCSVALLLPRVTLDSPGCPQEHKGLDQEPNVQAIFPPYPNRREREMGSRRRIWILSVMLSAVLLLAGPVPAASAFPDVPSNHPYHTAIEDLSNNNIMGGYTNGNFGPQDPVMRQQFAKMIVKTLGLAVTGSDVCPFIDVVAQTGTDPLYPSKYVAVCAQYNITQGKDATHFDPYAKITRLQVVTMIVRAAVNLAPGTLQNPPSGWSGQLSYGDPTHGANLRKAEYNALLAGLQGLSGSWNGYASTSRGECAQLLYNLLNKLNPPNPPNPPPTVKTWIRSVIGPVAQNWRPLIHGNHAAWFGLVGNHYQLFLHDIAAGVTSQITQGTAWEWDKENFDLQGNWLAIEANDGSQSDIFLYDIGAQKLTRLTYTVQSEKHPSISYNRMVWSGFDGQDWELFLYDTATGQTTQLTNNAIDEKDPLFDGEWIVSTGDWSPGDPSVLLEHVNGSFSRLLRTTAADLNPHVRGNFVVWERHDPGGGIDIYLHDIALNQTKILTPPVAAGVDMNPCIEGGRIVWERWDGNDHDYELVLYDLAAGTSTQLTNNSFSDYSPDLAGNDLVWSADTNYPGTDIYYRDLGQPSFGTPERLIIETVARNLYPQVHMGRVVWVRQLMDYDIFLAEQVDIPIVPLASSTVPR